MNLLNRLFPSKPDPREALRPLWHRTVELARDPVLYRDDGVADTVAGRFDMVTAMLAVVLLRMERDRVLAQETALLTELFVADMDGQLRESGVGDVVVGKHVGRLVSVLGGRLGAFREALADRGNEALEAALTRNVTMLEGHGTQALARRVRVFADKTAARDSKALLRGEIAL
ncbi:MAG: ubiquinol-cytochrome C chaperone family protein [Croceibacterium sp.]